MKKFNLTTVGLLALMLSACQSEMLESDSAFINTGEFEYSFEIASTKSLLEDARIVWEQGDKLGTFAGGLNNNSATVTIGATCTFKVRSGKALVKGDKIYAYYPYTEKAGSDYKAVNFTIPEAQTIKPWDGFDADAMPMAAVPYTVAESLLAESDYPVDGIHLRNLGSIIQFKLYSTNATQRANEKIKSVRFVASGDICGNYTADITKDTPPLTKISGGKSVTTTLSTSAEIPASKDKAIPLSMVVAPSTVSGTIYVYTNTSTYVKTVKSLTYSRNTVKGLVLDISTMKDMSVSFGDDVSGAQTFDTGVKKTYTLKVSSAITSKSVKSYPTGWTVSLSGSKLSVTSPSSTSGKALYGDIVLQGNIQGLGTIDVATLPVRLRGINCKDDLLAFRSAHGATESQYNSKSANPDTYAAAIEPYKVSGWITLNADIETITGDDFANSSCNFMHHLHEKFNGNNHTINLDVTGKNRAAILSFFQHIDASVKDLKFAGQMTQTAFDACAFATLAQQISTAGVTIENVNSSVNLTTSKANCLVGGLLSKSASVATTLKNCEYSGTITLSDACNGSSTDITVGGIVGQHTLGSGSYVFTVDGCKFSGKLNYSSSVHSTKSRFGGILGDQGRNAVIKNCTNSGTMTFQLQNMKIATGNGGGIGGILGRCNATTSGYTMETTVKDCAFTGKIIFNDSNSSQLSTYINKITGTPLSGYKDAESTGNTQTGAITYNKYSAAGSVAFADASELSFNAGETKDIAITSSGMSTLKLVETPKGWTINLNNWKTANKITVKAPTTLQGGGFNGTMTLKLEGKDNNSKTVYGNNTKVIRLFGINNDSELTEFSKTYGNSANDPTTTGIDKYLVNGEISINADIAIPSGCIAANAYWLKNLVLPLNGNGHTLTFETSRGHRGGLIQNLKANVHDLKLAGTVTATDPGANAGLFGALACENYLAGATVTNVESAVNIVISGSQTSSVPNYIGGLVGGNYNNNLNISFNNCKVSGNISYSIDCDAHIGGIIAGGTSLGGSTSAQEGKPGNVYSATNCIHSGNIDVLMSSQKDIRVGGIIGDSQRSSILTNCTNSGNLTIDCAGNDYHTKGFNGCGLGGLIGRQGAHVDGYDMTCTLTSCTNTGIITLRSVPDNGYNKESSGTSGCVGKFVGKNLNYGKTYSEKGTNTKAGSVVIILNSDAGIEKATGHFSIMQVSSTTSADGHFPDDISNSYILKTKNGKVIVLDGGKPGDAPHLRSLLLTNYGGTVDQWWISHPHGDHLGALLTILKDPQGIKVKEIYHSRFTAELLATEAGSANAYANPFYSILSQTTTIKSTDIQETGGLYEIDGVLIKVLGISNPDCTLKDDDNSPYNNSSMVLRIWDKDKSFLFLGDTQLQSSAKLLAATQYHKYLAVDYIQLAHHGQRGASWALYDKCTFSKALWPTPSWLFNNSVSGYKTNDTKTYLRNRGIGDTFWIVSCKTTDWYLE